MGKRYKAAITGYMVVACLCWKAIKERSHWAAAMALMIRNLYGD